MRQIRPASKAEMLTQSAASVKVVSDFNYIDECREFKRPYRSVLLQFRYVSPTRTAHQALFSGLPHLCLPDV